MTNGTRSKPDEWNAVFSFLEQEIKFQAAAAAVTGAAAAWWLKVILTQSKGATADNLALTHSFWGRLAAALLTMTAFLFLLDEGRLSKRYGDLSRAVADGDTATIAELKKTLVRGIWPKRRKDGWVAAPNWRETLIQWSPYYVARGLLFAVGAILVGLVFGCYS